MIGLRSTAAAALVAFAAASGIAAPPASADDDGGLTGTNKNRHGTITLYFTSDPGWLRMKLEGKVRTTSRGRLFVIQCRKGDAYKMIAGYHVGVTSRFIAGPATVPVGTDRCRVRRDGKVIAEIRMRAA